jgi:hypothetical protein
VRAVYDADQVVLTLDRDEIGRLAAVLAEATTTTTTTTTSRAEFFIRVGCSRPNIEALVRELESMASGRSDGFEMQLAAGVESEENPSRPRPMTALD